MAQLWNTILFQPILNLLVFFYNIIPGHDIGVAIILMTILIKLILYPSSLKSIATQKKMKDIQPKIEALKVKYKNQKEKLAQEMMVLYKNEKVNPLSSCLPLLIQLPIFIAIYQVFRIGLSHSSLDLLYSFIYNPGALNPIAFGFMDLSKVLSANLTGGSLWQMNNLLRFLFQFEFIIIALAVVSQIIQMKMLVAKKPEIKTAGSQDESMTAIMNKQMTFMMPLMTLFIGVTLPVGLSLYWLVNGLFTIVQQYFVFKKKTNHNIEILDKKNNIDISTNNTVTPEIKEIENK